MKRRAVISCTYPVNRGDELLLATARYYAESAGLDIRTTVLNRAAGSGMIQPLRLLMLVDAFVSTRLASTISGPLFRVLMMYIALASRLPKWLSRTVEPAAWQRLRAAFRQSDVCIATAGGYLIAENSDEWTWLSHILTLRIAQAENVCVVGAPCSIGPFHQKWAPYVADALNCFDVLCLRDDYSLELVSAASAQRTQVYRTPDLAFGYPWPRPSSSLEVPTARRIGVSVRYYRFGGGQQGAVLRSAFEEKICSALDSLAAANDAQIVFFAQDHLGMYSDSEYSARIAAKLTAATEVIDERLELTDLLYRYSQMSVLIGVRMHACISAVCMGTPVVPIGYEPKTVSAFSDFDKSIRVHDIRDLKEESLYADANHAILSDSTPLRLARRSRAEKLAQRLSPFTATLSAGYAVVPAGHRSP